MRLHRIDPIDDQRWLHLLECHPEASVFHTPAWLQALRRTYGYDAGALTTAAPGENVTNGLVFCQVNSWLTGRRIVSTPFADHCQPLATGAEELGRLLAGLKQLLEDERLSYVELRPLHCDVEALKASFKKTQGFYLHKVDLRPKLEDLLRSFHKTCVQNKIRRARREGLTYDHGRSEALLDTFYQLLLLTRRRHRLPPQPVVWFRNLARCFGDRLTVKVARKNGVPVAAILTLAFKRSVVYKYGCSNATFNNLGGMQFLFWNTIQEAKEEGAQEFDLGRSDLDNPGLTAFKDHWTTQRKELVYLRYPGCPSRIYSGWKLQVAKRIFARTPPGVLSAAGRLLYRHLA